MLSATKAVGANYLKLICGYLVYFLTGNTPSFGYQAMLKSFVESGGKFNDVVSKIISLRHPAYHFANATGVLGNLSNFEIDRINIKLREDGFYIFKNKISPDLCDKLLNFALTQRAFITVSTDGSRPSEYPFAVYDRENPKGLIYAFDNEDVINHPIIQDLMCDLSILSVAQGYLGSAPVLDMPSFWWSSKATAGASDEAAQTFHFDLDRIRWIKFFIYLTDVGSENGPHVFVKGTNRTGGIPKALLDKKYARLSDAEVEAEVSQDQIISMVGLRGTILAEDTRGLHKGQAVRAGDRLVLQFQFSNSLFGSSFTPKRINQFHSEHGKKLFAQYPRIFSYFTKRKET